MKNSDGVLMPHEIRERHSETVAKWLGAVIAVLLCAFLLALALSGILRYSLSDGAVFASASKLDPEGIFVTGDAGKVSLSVFLTSSLASAGRDAGITAADAKRMIYESSFREKLAALVVDAKNAAESGNGMIRGLSFIADWMEENPDTVADICGVELTDGEISNIREELSYDAVDFGEDAILSDDGTLRVLLSNGFFFAAAALSAAALPALLVAGNFKAKFFLSRTGIALLVSGIALSGLLLFALVKSTGAGIVVSAVTSGAARITIYAAGGAVLAGIVFVLTAGLISRRQSRDEENY